ncbi:TetR/AcrR family transcriptional regulator [Sedimentitalea sp. JM2-8]|uniref:TetR/AcrR family transcriptional regulator n=1 Tax=Sedimentitalea xiamensis TaxID=3050037 RepID=A0ABT7FF05_9RHOB|nr:TetR/AcrR family transcriptional regulator [Sedimentitalea xiamensis]MDK3073701.1 TetR/AcrR family transcriptional regulator [Sedimentitalea xiamensis]
MKRNPRRRPGGPTLKDKQSEETRRRLIAAARDLFDDYGYHAVSVSDIARAAGVTHSMINVYFNSKAGLLYQIVNERIVIDTTAATEIAARSGPVRERLESIVRVFAEHDLRDPEQLAVTMSYFWTWPEETEAENQLQIAQVFTPVKKVLCEAIAESSLSAQIDPDVALRAIFAIYTMGLRAGVYGNASVEDCVAGIMAQIGLLLRLPAAGS